MQPIAGVVPMPGQGIVSSSHSASSSTLIDQSSGDVIDLLMSAASKSSLNVGDDINNSTEPTDSNKAEAEEEGEEETSTHINPYNPDGKSYLYSIEFVIALRDSPLCKTPESFILPDISVPKPKTTYYNGSTSFSRVDGAFNQPSRNRDEAYQGGRYNQRNTNGANTQQGSHAYNRATRNRTNAGETSVSTTFNNTNQNKNQPRARHNDTSNKELLDKFELLGRERRGITPSSYKVQEDNTVDGDWELPSESNILELSQTSNGHSIQEFEEWKAKMREKEGLSRQNNSDNSNNEPRQPGMFDDIMSFNNNDQMNFPSRQQNSNSMDSMYRMEEMLFNQMSSQIAGFSQSSSRFSSFFNGSDNKGGKSSEASPQFENKEPQDADAIAFQRIMSMLNDGQENKQHSPEQQQSTSLNANNMVPENSNDDAFFMSLLNKGGNTESKSPKGASESNNNGQAVAERNNDTRIPSAAQSPVIDVVRQPVRGDPPFQSPHIQAGNLPFPPVPPEWMQKQMPGMPPMPMISNMMPGLPFPPPGMMNGSGNQNSPSNMPPPHINGNMPMMPPPPPMMGMPPMPPGMFPMGVPQNGQFPGLPPLPPPGAMGPPMGMSENGQFQGLPPMPLPGSMGPPNPGMNMGGIPPGMSPRISNNERRVRPQ